VPFCIAPTAVLSETVVTPLAACQTDDSRHRQRAVQCAQYKLHGSARCIWQCVQYNAIFSHQLTLSCAVVIVVVYICLRRMTHVVIVVVYICLRRMTHVVIVVVYICLRRMTRFSRSGVPWETILSDFCLFMPCFTVKFLPHWGPSCFRCCCYCCYCCCCCCWPLRLPPVEAMKQLWELQAVQGVAWSEATSKVSCCCCCCLVLLSPLWQTTIVM
jgi:hypothetical protein